MNKKLYVGNLLYEVTDDQLRDFFSQAGTVETASVIRFADSGRSKGFGFVEMASEEEAQKAIEMFHDQDMNGRQIIVNIARPPRERGSFDRGGDRGGSFDRGGSYDRRGGGNGGGGDRGPRRSFNRGGDRGGNGNVFRNRDDFGGQE